MIFVDTGAWFAVTVPTDPDHAAALSWMESNDEGLVTTDYIIAEPLTLLRARREARRALLIGDQFFEGRLAAIHYLSTNDIQQAWDVFRRFTDKDWSFTDCTSKVVMERLGITHAFAFDQDFRQFGTVTVVP